MLWYLTWKVVKRTFELFIPSEEKAYVFFCNSKPPTVIVILQSGRIHVLTYLNSTLEWQQTCIGYLIKPQQHVKDDSVHSSVKYEEVNIECAWLCQTRNELLWCESKQTKRGHVIFSLCKQSLTTIIRNDLNVDLSKYTQVLMKSPGMFEIHESLDTLFIFLCSPVPSGCFFVMNSYSKLQLLNVYGENLWSSNYICVLDITDFFKSNLNIITRINTSVVRVTSDKINDRICLLTSKNELILLNSSGDNCGKVNIYLKNQVLLEDIKDCFSLCGWLFCIVQSSVLSVFDMDSGEFLHELDLSGDVPIGFCYYDNKYKIWGYYSTKKICVLKLNTPNQLLISKCPRYQKLLFMVHQHEIQLLTFIQYVISGKLCASELPRQLPASKFLQSKAVLLALLQYNREWNSNTCTSTEKALMEMVNESWPEIKTRLSIALKPLVECYLQVEEGRKRLFV
ncbi:uncharacterized protein LOC143229079 [Tachypleus tridentatus]|uniref:uncharacterized protein LOC143229079 n=1 Tax=Tachypleus tridentatus TaxID=6853 RepID=UPI003FD49873